MADDFERVRQAKRDYRRRAAEAEETPEIEFRPEDRVFTTIADEPAKSLHQAMIEDLLTKAKLRKGASGVPRSTDCFRRTYATFRLAEGVDVYFLAEQMGTSVRMIAEHYGHVNTVKHADPVLQGMGGWDGGAGDSEAADTAKPSRTPRAKNRTTAFRAKHRRRKS